MKQYCRYCSWLCYGDAPYCEVKEEVKSESAIRHANKCHDFTLSELGDVETGKQYRPMEKRTYRASDGQIRMNIEEE